MADPRAVMAVLAGLGGFEVAPKKGDVSLRRGRSLVALMVAVACCARPGLAQSLSDQKAEALARGVTQLRETLGDWNVTTEFLKPDGSVARTASGTYSFSWVVEDRVLRGESAIPDLAQTSALLFYVDQAAGRLEMASVGKDGHLWVMTGPADGETWVPGNHQVFVRRSRLPARQP
jgi:hypothetical protein